ncbi:hypothetical protein SBV1_270072 [Verrucomicrobia bacterium]|nr:hypothetical protein SBV1_270072 [Verrucomicrobiota bacterium]
MASRAQAPRTSATTFAPEPANSAIRRCCSWPSLKMAWASFSRGSGAATPAAPRASLPCSITANPQMSAARLNSKPGAKHSASPLSHLRLWASGPKPSLISWLRVCRRGP